MWRAARVTGLGSPEWDDVESRPARTGSRLGVDVPRAAHLDVVYDPFELPASWKLAGCLSSHPPDQAAGLAATAEVGDALVGGDSRDGRPAARAGLLGAHVHREEVARLEGDLLAHLGSDLVPRVQERAAHGVVQAVDLLRGQAGALAERGALRRPHDLVRGGVSDAGPKLGPNQDALDLPAERPQSQAELVAVHIQRVGSP